MTDPAASAPVEGPASPRPRVGLVGAGTMGRGMGENLLKAGFPLRVVAHRSRGGVDRLVAAGASEAGDLGALVDGADVVLLCLPDADVATAVVEGIAPRLRPDQLVIDTGTAPPEVSRRLEALCAGAGALFAEAPVAGGRQQAEAGALGALVGARPEALERALPVLETFSATVQHFGPVGTASLAKLVNNYVVMGMVALVTEAYGLAADAGVPWDRLYDVMIRGAGDSGVLRRIGGGAVAGDFSVYAFPVKGAAKDLAYFRRTVAAAGGPSPLAREVSAVFERAVDAGHGERLLGELLRPDVRAALARREGEGEG